MTPREALQSLFAAWDGGDALRASAHFAPDAIYAEAKREPIVGRDAIIQHFLRFFRDGPHFEFGVDDIIVEDTRAAVSYRFRLEALGTAWIEKAGCALVHFDEGAITSWREFEG